MAKKMDTPSCILKTKIRLSAPSPFLMGSISENGGLESKQLQPLNKTDNHTFRLKKIEQLEEFQPKCKKRAILGVSVLLCKMRSFHKEV
jgi:hypothetical protein